jgi:hypothetical protein
METDGPSEAAPHTTILSVRSGRKRWNDKVFRWKYKKTTRLETDNVRIVMINITVLTML